MAGNHRRSRQQTFPRISGNAKRPHEKAATKCTIDEKPPETLQALETTEDCVILGMTPVIRTNSKNNPKL